MLSLGMVPNGIVMTEFITNEILSFYFKIELKMHSYEI